MGRGIPYNPAYSIPNVSHLVSLYIPFFVEVIWAINFDINNFSDTFHILGCYGNVEQLRGYGDPDPAEKHV